MTSPRDLSFRGLIATPPRGLEEIFRSSKSPDLERLPGRVFRGCNPPWHARLLGIQKFMKGFLRGENGIEGYNLPVRQDGLDAPWSAKPSDESPRRFGYYLARPVDPNARDSKYPDSALLDYGASPRNPWYAVEKVLRDYVVQPDPANPDVLLGKAYLAFGPARVKANFFVLAYDREGPKEI